jgi:hypothetical protein
MSFKLTNEIAAGTVAWDEARSVGPQEDGLAYANVISVKPVKKSKVYQLEIEFSVEGPDHRKGESYKCWENVAALPGADAKTVKACNSNVVKLLGAAFPGAVDDNGKLVKPVSAGFDIGEKLVGRTMPTYTFAATGEYQPEVKILTIPQAKGVEAGNVNVTAERRAKGANRNGATNKAAMNAGNEDVFGSDDVFETPTATNTTSSNAVEADPWG